MTPIWGALSTVSGKISTSLFLPFNVFVLTETKSSQLQWDQINCKIVSENLKTSFDQNRLVCFLAASQPHTGAWLTVLPASSLGNLLSNDCLRYAVALRTGSNVCQNFTCRCGEEVDKFGLHPLSCVKSGCRYLRHCALNNIVFRALNFAGFNSILEPSGLGFDAIKRPEASLFFRIKNSVLDLGCHLYGHVFCIRISQFDSLSRLFCS